MRKFFNEAKKKIRSFTRQSENGKATKQISVEEATRLTVQRYGDALRNLADK